MTRTESNIGVLIELLLLSSLPTLSPYDVGSEALIAETLT